MSGLLGARIGKVSLSKKNEDVVHLFGVDVDYQLNFDQHISSLSAVECLEEVESLFIKTKYTYNFHTVIFSNFNYCLLF